MKKLFSLILCLFLLCPVLTVLADNPKVVDEAGLLCPDEIAALEEKAGQITDTYGMDVVILTVDDFYAVSSSIEVFADNYYDNNGYGIGEEGHGVILVISMDTREWAISTCGDAIYAITDYGIESLFEEMAWYLSDNEFYYAFNAYLDSLPRYFEAYQAGSPLDGYAGSYNGPGSVVIGTREDVVYYESDPPLWASPIIGAVIAAVIVLIMRSAMNTKRPQRSAVDYMNRSSANFRRQQDIFLYSQVHRVRKQTQSSGGGGGSSVHRSSGGRSHGGGHGRF